ncbi:hypothetical protein [Calothrix sp. UHCC 0171]|nr:hypothetical protein [Calothrix sp. UHCC 0171]MEA5571289.1 hypothetical protein [Calothrix sp. UHCC 0171]
MIWIYAIATNCFYRQVDCSAKFLDMGSSTNVLFNVFNLLIIDDF